MPGPPPKGQGQRRRRNKQPAGTTAIVPVDPDVIEAVDAGTFDGDVDSLPPIIHQASLQARDDGDDWHPAAVACFEAIRRSPMASQINEADIHLLLPLIDLIHLYWKIKIYSTDPDTGLDFIDSRKVRLRFQMLAEIRLMAQNFGLTPKDRYLLKWTASEAEASESRAAQRRVAKAAQSKDPRDLF
jgi:hypothetical protein